MIAVAHHNLLDESRIYEEDCTIEHSDELERFLDDWDVELFLSGHLHVQHYRTSEDHDIDEIVTGALTTSPCPYGVLINKDLVILHIIRKKWMYLPGQRKRIIRIQISRISRSTPTNSCRTYFTATPRQILSNIPFPKRKRKKWRNCMH